MSAGDELDRREDPEVVVEAHWPYDGPHDERSVVSAAVAVAALVRYLNNATRHASALPTPSSAAQVLAALSTVLERAPQLLQQLDAAAGRFAGDGAEHYDDRGDRPADATLAELRSALAVAQSVREPFARAVNRAAVEAYHLGTRYPADDQ